MTAYETVAQARYEHFKKGRLSPMTNQRLDAAASQLRERLATESVESVLSRGREIDDGIFGIRLAS